MFTHPVHFDDEYRVVYHEHAKKFFLKSFQKKYKGIIWRQTERAFCYSLARIGFKDNNLQMSQQIDELWREEELIVFKYDFKIFGTKTSTKSSGNRIVGILDNKERMITIILIYHKSHLPKNISETNYIRQIYNEISYSRL